MVDYAVSHGLLGVKLQDLDVGVSKFGQDGVGMLPEPRGRRGRSEGTAVHVYSAAENGCGALVRGRDVDLVQQSAEGYLLLVQGFLYG
jgi:hypothetical protein